MIVGTGIDIAEVPRIAASIERFGDRFLHRIFTEGERRYCESKANRVERYAARINIAIDAARVEVERRRAAQLSDDEKARRAADTPLGACLRR